MVEKKSGEIYPLKIILDTNIIFSALLNSDSSIGEVLFNSSDYFEFYGCDYMRHEIDKLD